MSADKPPAASLALDAEVLKPLISAVVAEVLAAIGADKAKLGDRLSYSVAEAARLLGLHTHQLRDERLRGRIAASKIVGGRIAYQREDLIRYLTDRRTEAS
jgi:hypothetical protein